QQLDPVQFSRARAAIAAALGQFQATEQVERAQRSAHALSALLEQGDISYLVEAAAAEALGKTRTAGCSELLEKLLQRPTWNATVERGAFKGLALSGEEHVVEILTSYLTDTHRHPMLRLA